VFDVTMNEPRPETPAGKAEQSILDRSQQAARFLDLTRQRALEPDADEGMVLPLVAAHLRGVMAANIQIEIEINRVGEDLPDSQIGEAAADADDIDDISADDVDADDIRIDPSAFGAIRPGAVPPGAGLGGFSLDDDGDVFGDGNGFGAGTRFGADDAP
jgi:hypothetical protein